MVPEKTFVLTHSDIAMLLDDLNGRNKVYDSRAATTTIDKMLFCSIAAMSKKLEHMFVLPTLYKCCTIQSLHLSVQGHYEISKRKPATIMLDLH